MPHRRRAPFTALRLRLPAATPPSRPSPTRAAGCSSTCARRGAAIGLLNKIRAYHLQDQGDDTVEANRKLGFPADLRDYGIGAQMLYDLGVKKLKLLTNNPRKVAALQGYGIEIVERVPLHVGENPYNERYLETKREKLGHLAD